MSIIDVEKLLAPVSPDNPVGDDLSYDPAYMELEQLAAGKPEQQVGDTIIPAEEPNWKEVGKRCAELLTRTKDLRVIVQLTIAALKLNGLEGLRDGLALLKGSLETYWDKVYPQLDPDDGNDPLLRMNIISALTDPVGFWRHVREAPIVSSKLIGRFGLKDIEVALGEVPAPPQADGQPGPVAKATIDGAVDSAEVPDLESTAKAASSIYETVKALDTWLTQTVGASKAINFKDFEKLLANIDRHAQTFLAKRTGGAAPANGDGAVAEFHERGAGHTGSGSTAGVIGGIPGEIRSKQDVIRLIDKICAFYEANEPSSPIPLLLKRTQRLVGKNFLEIIKDLTPGTLSTIEALAGIEPPAAS